MLLKYERLAGMLKYERLAGSNTDKDQLVFVDE